MIAQARSAWPVSPARLALYVTWRWLAVSSARIAMKLAAISVAPASNSIRPLMKTFFALSTISVLTATL